jgi:hypothetical protein
MPDGVVLLGDHYRAAEDDRPLPAVLIRSPQAGRVSDEAAADQHGDGIVGPLPARAAA